MTYPNENLEILEMHSSRRTARGSPESLSIAGEALVFKNLRFASINSCLIANEKYLLKACLLCPKLQPLFPSLSSYDVLPNKELIYLNEKRTTTTNTHDEIQRLQQKRVRN